MSSKIYANISGTGANNLVGLGKSPVFGIAIRKLRIFRPLDVVYLLGDSSKAKNKLKWKPNKNINPLINDMINYEINNLNH